MPKYLVSANYVGEGIKRLLKDGGSARQAAVEKLGASLGGSVESMYYAFGETDLFIIADIARQCQYDCPGAYRWRQWSGYPHHHGAYDPRGG